jgi:fumarylacetoacetase
MQRRALPKFLFPDAFATDFTLANLPYGVFRHPSGQARIGTALGDRIIDLAELSRAGLLTGKAGLTESTLNSFMGAGRSIWSEVRSDLQNLLSDDGSKSLAHSPDVLASAVQPLEGTELLLPAAIGDYTDFYASEDHASNVGKIFRPDGEPLLPNWKHIPVGYHGRASSVVVSGTGIRRPSGQLKPPGADKPSFGPSKSFDIELEMGAFIGPGNALGDPVSLAEAEDHIFGLVLLNDWSARDIQVWEYVPLGPFLGKNFGTTISPWVVPLEALEPFRLSPPVRRAGDPEALPYLQHASTDRPMFDVKLEVLLRTPGMREPALVATSNLKYMYWSISQQVTHHTCGGCNLRPGDLLGTGTLSGPGGRKETGSLLEMTWRGQEKIVLPTGEERAYLQDGDEVVLRGYCEDAEGNRLGFGDCRGHILPPR